MKVLGIVAEYDPFHNGHLFHLAEAKRRVSPDWTCVALSPCLKQRGTLPLLFPADRARCALEAGADAVFALPVLWTVRDAEHYALGAVSLLGSLGATHLAFGAETDSLDLLWAAARLLEAPGPAFETALKEGLVAGQGYPAALSAAVSAALPGAEGLLDKPNNILAVCYLRAVLKLRLRITPVLIPRKGDYHSPRIDPAAPSASALRDSLLRGSYSEAYRAVPPFCAELLRRRFLEQRIPDERVLDALLLSRLRSMSDAEYLNLPDLSEGMENALRTVAKTCLSRKELIASLSGKRYPAARISRLCACALLGVTREDLEAMPLPASALLLGLRKNSAMTAAWKELPVPVVSSFAEWAKTAHPADLSAWRLLAQCCRLRDTLPYTEKIVTV